MPLEYAKRWRCGPFNDEKGYRPVPGARNLKGDQFVKKMTLKSLTTINSKINIIRKRKHAHARAQLQ